LLANLISYVSKQDQIAMSSPASKVFGITPESAFTISQELCS